MHLHLHLQVALSHVVWRESESKATFNVIYIGVNWCKLVFLLFRYNAVTGEWAKDDIFIKISSQVLWHHHTLVFCMILKLQFCNINILLILIIMYSLGLLIGIYFFYSHLEKEPWENASDRESSKYIEYIYTLD